MTSSKTNLIAFLIIWLVICLLSVSYLSLWSEPFVEMNSSFFEDVRFNQTEIIEVYSNDDLEKITTIVVSIYFSLDYGKHSQAEFLNWNRNMLLSVEAPLVVFTDQKSKQYIMDVRQMTNRSSKLFNTVLFVYNDIWHLMSELENKRQKSYAFEYSNQQHRLDPERNIHSPGLYAVWNLKLFALAKVAKMNKFAGKFFIYTDMGAWRNGVLHHWPDQNFVSILSVLLEERMLFGHVYDIPIYDPLKSILQGGFYAGSLEAIRHFENGFYDLHDKRIDQGLFVGKDQTLINIYEFDSNNGKNVLLKAWLAGTCDQKSYDPWLFYQYYLAPKVYYNCSYEYSLLIKNLS